FRRGTGDRLVLVNGAALGPVTGAALGPVTRAAPGSSVAFIATRVAAAAVTHSAATPNAHRRAPAPIAMADHGTTRLLLLPRHLGRRDGAVGAGGAFDGHRGTGLEVGEFGGLGELYGGAGGGADRDHIATRGL